MSETQRSAVAVELANLNNGQTKSGAQICTAVSQDDAAQMMNISKRSVQYAKEVKDKGIPSLFEALKNDKISVSKAAQIAELSEKEQEDAVEASGKQIKKTGSVEWYTPEEYIKAAHKAMGAIDLDPASSEEANKIVKADIFFTKDDDGIQHDWKGRVWLHPPRSNNTIPKFVEKLITEYKDGNCTDAILLSHNNTDTQWFQDIAKMSNSICFPKDKIQFHCGGQTISPTRGQVFFYLGSNVKEFASAFSQYGIIVVPE